MKKILFRNDMSCFGKKMEKYIVFGVGGFLSDIFDIIHANNGKVVKIFQNVPEVVSDGDISLKQRLSFLDYSIKVYDSLEEFKPEDGCHYVLGCVSIKKYQLVESLKNRHGIKFSQLIHPDAHIGSNVYLGEGVMISPGVIIGPNSNLGDFCSINRLASIGHDVRIGKYCKIRSCATIGGLCRIGEKTQINMSASILDKIHIGNFAVIGACAFVNKDIPDGVVAHGVPAKIIRKNEDV